MYGKSRLGKAKPIMEPITDYETEIIDEDFPIVTFFFKYRSESKSIYSFQTQTSLTKLLEALKELCVIPRTPEPTFADIDANTMPVAVAEGLANNLRNQVERLITGVLVRCSSFLL